jgi:hypothetical protein
MKLMVRESNTIEEGERETSHKFRRKLIRFKKNF